MAGIYLFVPGEFIPAGSYSNTLLGEFHIIPRPREGWRMLTPQTSGNSVVRGRFVNKNANFTSITIQTATPISGFDRNGRYGAANGGLEHQIIAINATTVQAANTWMMPNFRILAAGTAGTNDTDCCIAMIFGFPVEAVICNYAAAGMPWSAGQNLLDLRGNYRGFMW